MAASTECSPSNGDAAADVEKTLQAKREADLNPSDVSPKKRLPENGLGDCAETFLTGPSISSQLQTRSASGSSPVSGSKSLPAATTAVATVRCKQPGGDFLILEVAKMPGDDETLELEMLQSSGWVLGQRWVSVSNATWGMSESGDHNVYISGLTPSSKYHFRVNGDKDRRGVFMTLRLPPAPSAPRIVERRPNALVVEWTTMRVDEKVPTVECSLEYYCMGAFYDTWKEAPAGEGGSKVWKVKAKRPDGVAPAASAAADASSVEHWRAEVGNLESAGSSAGGGLNTAIAAASSITAPLRPSITASGQANCNGMEYMFRVRCRNAAGWSPEYSATGSGRTSARPQPPSALRVTERRPGSVTVTFGLTDEEGAPTRSIEVEVAGVLQWQPMSAANVSQAISPPLSPALASAAGRAPVRTGTVTVDGLPAETTSSLRLWAENAVGRATMPSEAIVVQPSEKPTPPRQIDCSGRGVDCLQIEWSTKDPLGAPVMKCMVTYCCDQVFGVWETLTLEADSRARGYRGRSRWQATVRGLQPETNYIVRIFAVNEVGTSSSTDMLFRTADPPKPAHSLKVLQRYVNGVDIAFSTFCDPRQLRLVEAVKAVKVETSTYLGFWKVVPQEDINLVMFPDSTVPQQGAVAQTQDVPVRGITSIRNIAPDMQHTFRLWLQNDAGFHAEAPPSLQCWTCCRPKAPEELSVSTRSAGSLVLSWNVSDPEGCPVDDSEVQVREAAVFAEWFTPTGSDTKRVHKDNPFGQWSQIVEGLKPRTPYLIRARTHNGVGWSNWSTEEGESTSSAPEFTEQEVILRPAVAGVAVDAVIADPVGAPVAMCIFTNRHAGKQVAAFRVRQSTTWRAIFPKPPKEANLDLQIVALNASGWSQQVSVCYTARQLDVKKGVVRPPTNEEELRVLSRSMRTFLNLVRQWEQAQEALIKSYIEKPTRAGGGSKDNVSSVSSQSHGDEPDAEPSVDINRQLQQRLARSGEVVAGLAELAALQDANIDACRNWRDRVQVFSAGLSAHKGSFPEVTADADMDSIRLVFEAFRLLVQGGIWIDVIVAEKVEPLWKRISSYVDTTPDAARVCHMWVQQRDVWTERHRGQQMAVWKDAMQLSLQLLCALQNRSAVTATPEAVQNILKVLTKVYDAVAAQHTKLSAAVTRLEQLSQGQSRQGFAAETTRAKVMSTALGLLLSATLPLPGSIESGLVSVSMLWIADDVAGRHVVIEHSKENGADGLWKKFQQLPQPRSRRLLASWAESEDAKSVLVHNASARRLTVQLVDGEAGVMSRAYSTIKEAHPLVRILTKSVEKGISVVTGSEQQTLLVIEPTCIAAIPLPVEELGSDRTYDMVFAYGDEQHMERQVGSCSTRPGAAVSFVSLDNAVQINNSTALCRKLELEDHADGAVEQASLGAETAAMGDASGIKIVNKDFQPITVKCYRSATLFEPLAASVVVEAGAEGSVQVLEDAAAASSACRLHDGWWKSSRRGPLVLRGSAVTLLDGTEGQLNLLDAQQNVSLRIGETDVSGKLADADTMLWTSQGEEIADEWKKIAAGKLLLQSRWASESQEFIYDVCGMTARRSDGCELSIVLEDETTMCRCGSGEADAAVKGSLLVDGDTPAVTWDNGDVWKLVISDEKSQEMPADDKLFEIEILTGNGKVKCNARHGQVLTHEGCL
eukprot:TRINITY_DN69511_c0_g1_i1.p1 TRINITY_DN69511_c0_g1~~TRINITY_DN69511_c0_g1_i1.p1  ORF type:complete len:1666 (-),score=379.17 TRINITY_DN69511_c0_g1_i1:83-5080(-)